MVPGLVIFECGGLSNFRVWFWRGYLYRYRYATETQPSEPFLSIPQVRALASC